MIHNKEATRFSYSSENKVEQGHAVHAVANWPLGSSSCDRLLRGTVCSADPLVGWVCGGGAGRGREIRESLRLYFALPTYQTASAINVKEMLNQLCLSCNLFYNILICLLIGMA